jgi:hypothetical protein
VAITENGRRRKITKREGVIKQLVNKSASADPRSLKILLDLMLNLEARARSSPDLAPRTEPYPSASPCGSLQPPAPEQIELQLPPQHQRQPPRAPLSRPPQP